MGFRLKHGFAFTTVLGLFGLVAISLQLRNGISQQLNVLFTSHIQSHQYNIPGLSQEPNCRVRIIYNLNTSGLKEIQDERKSRIKDVCGMCRRNRSSVGCTHVAPDTEYHRSFQTFYANLLVDDKHKVGDCFRHRYYFVLEKNRMAKIFPGVCSFQPKLYQLMCASQCNCDGKVHTCSLQNSQNSQKRTHPSL